MAQDLKPFYFGYTSKHGECQGAMIYKLCMASYLFSTPTKPIMFASRGGFLTWSRTRLFRDIRNHTSDPVPRALVFDADIDLVSSLEHLVECIEFADKYHYNFVAPYSDADRNILCFMDGRRIPKAEFKEKYHDWDRIQFAGLGFYYGDIPNYKFHMEYDSGEDHNFFTENPGLDLRVVPSIKLRHIKEIIIDEE